MNRKQFLVSFFSLFSIPFLRFSKKSQKTNTDIDLEGSKKENDYYYYL